MPFYYLTPYVGTGTNEDPFTPKGASGAWSAIDLRPDCSVATGYALLCLPDRSDAADRTYLGNSKTGNMNVADRTAVAAKLGILDAITSTKFDQLIAALSPKLPLNTAPAAQSDGRAEP